MNWFKKLWNRYFGKKPVVEKTQVQDFAGSKTIIKTPDIILGVNRTTSGSVKITKQKDRVYQTVEPTKVTATSTTDSSSDIANMALLYTILHSEQIGSPAPAPESFKSGQGGDFGGGGASGSWDSPSPAPSPSYEAPAPAPSYESSSYSSSSYDSGSSSSSYDSSSSYSSTD